MYDRAGTAEWLKAALTKNQSKSLNSLNPIWAERLSVLA
jgi:hypothetical protein